MKPPNPFLPPNLDAKGVLLNFKVTEPMREAIEAMRVTPKTILSRSDLLRLALAEKWERDKGEKK